MTLEQYGKKYRPYFVTLTYSPSNLPDNPAQCMKEVQKFIKLLRRRLEPPLRYFAVTERGTKKGRLHNHLLIWNEQLARMTLHEQWRLQYDLWNKGRLESVPIRASGGFWYVAKYIVKNLCETPKTDSTHCRRTGKNKRPGRLYSWSNRPQFGDSGIQKWYKLIKNWQKKDELPPNNFQFILFNKLHKVYIPKDTYMRKVKKMGYIFHECGVVWIDPKMDDDKREKEIFRWAEEKRKELTKLTR